MANPLMGIMSSNASSAAQAAPAGMTIDPKVIQSAKRMMGMLQMAKNPQQAIMQAAQQNPQLNAVLQMVGGRNPKDVFYEECQKHGINPEAVMKQLM